MKLAAWIGIAILTFCIALGASSAFTIYYVRQNDAVQCQALNDILQFANLHNQPFDRALHEWAVNYRCQPD